MLIRHLRNRQVDPAACRDITRAGFLESPKGLAAESDALYRQINKVERDIGGDSGVVGVSGSVSRLDLSRIFDVAGLNDVAHLLDIGSGIGRPMLHALVAGASRASGIEFDGMKHAKCQTVISRILPVEDQARTCCHLMDILNLDSLRSLDNTITHLYSFWEGIPLDARAKIGQLVMDDWINGGSITSVAFVQAHVKSLEAYLLALGFPSSMTLVESFPVSMIGSANKFQAYVLKVNPRLSSMKRRFSHNISKSVVKRAHLELARKPKATKRLAEKENRPMIGLEDGEVILGDFIIERRRTRARSSHRSTASMLDSPNRLHTRIASLTTSNLRGHEMSRMSSTDVSCVESDSGHSLPHAGPNVRPFEDEDLDDLSSLSSVGSFSDTEN